MAELGQFVVFDREIQKVDKLMDAVADEVFKRIYDRTPVDTGYAQSRWVMYKEAGGFDIMNDADYISYLEDGWSGQAPNGMMAVTLNEIDNIVDEQVKRLER